jgi:hypothetical protein
MFFVSSQDITCLLRNDYVAGLRLPVIPTLLVRQAIMHSPNTLYTALLFYLVALKDLAGPANHVVSPYRSI